MGGDRPFHADEPSGCAVGGRPAGDLRHRPRAQERRTPATVSCPSPLCGWMIRLLTDDGPAVVSGGRCPLPSRPSLDPLACDRPAERAGGPQRAGSPRRPHSTAPASRPIARRLSASPTSRRGIGPPQAADRGPGLRCQPLALRPARGGHHRGHPRHALAQAPDPARQAALPGSLAHRGRILPPQGLQACRDPRSLPSGRRSRTRGTSSPPSSRSGAAWARTLALGTEPSTPTDIPTLLARGHFNLVATSGVGGMPFLAYRRQRNHVVGGLPCILDIPAID